MMIIRQVSYADAPRLAEIYAYYVENFPYSFEYEPPSADEMLRRIRELEKKFPFYVCEESGIVLGFAYAHPYKERKAYQWICETSIYVDKNTTKSGIGTFLYEKLLTALQKQGFTKAFAVLGCPNEGSERFHEKMGFKFLAEFKDQGYKFGEWHDVKYYEKQLNPAKKDISEPIPFAQIQ